MAKLVLEIVGIKELVILLSESKSLGMVPKGLQLSREESHALMSDRDVMQYTYPDDLTDSGNRKIVGVPIEVVR